MLWPWKQSEACSQSEIRQKGKAGHGAASLFSSLHVPIAGFGLFGALFILGLAYATSAQGPDPQQLFQEAFAAQQRGDATLAVLKYQELLRLYPDVVAARANLGVVLASLGRFDEAIVQYRSALRQVPDNRGLRLNLALAYYKKGAFSEAADEFSSLHETEPGDVRVATLLGQCYVRLGRDAQAISLLTPFEKANPDNLDLAWALGSALIRSGETQEGLARVERVAGQGHSAEAYMVAAQSYLKFGDLDPARRNFDRAMRLNPQQPGLYTLGGMIMEYSGDPQGAAGAFQKALETNPNDFEARLHFGAVLYEQRQLDAARLQLDRALAIDPSSPLARYQLARVKRAQGQLAEAVRDLERVERDEPNWIAPHVELSALYYRLKRAEDGAREKQIVDRLSTEQGDRRSRSRIIDPRFPSP
jgi:tetratricopeptide (TPR) repeat protein